jgi:hypothetical protein
MQFAAAIDVNGSQLARRPGSGLCSTAKVAQPLGNWGKPGRGEPIAPHRPCIGNFVVRLDVLPQQRSPLAFCHVVPINVLATSLHHQMAYLDGVRGAVQREGQKVP